MFRVFRTIAVLAASLPFALSAQDELSWHDSYQDALLEAKEAGKPIFLEFRCAP